MRRVEVSSSAARRQGPEQEVCGDAAEDAQVPAHGGGLLLTGGGPSINFLVLAVFGETREIFEDNEVSNKVAHFPVLLVFIELEKGPVEGRCSGILIPNLAPCGKSS